MTWFVQPDPVTLPLSEGQSITVRRRLNTGEARAARKRIVDPTDTSLALVSAYLLDWTLPEFPIKDAPINTVLSVLDNLDPIRFNEIADAISTHVEAMRAAREQEKNSQDGEKKS